MLPTGESRTVQSLIAPFMYDASVIHQPIEWCKIETPARFPDHVGRIMLDTFAEEVGAALRRAREARKLSLRDAVRVSTGAFKTSTLASYERPQASRFARAILPTRVPVRDLTRPIAR